MVQRMWTGWLTTEIIWKGFARARIQMAAAQRAHVNDAKVSQMSLREGQLVYQRVHAHKGRRKIQDAWDPTTYRIVRCPEGQWSVYSIVPVDGGKVRHIHRSELRPVYVPSDGHIESLGLFPLSKDPEEWRRDKKICDVLSSMVTHTRNWSSAFNPSKCTHTAVSSEHTHCEHAPGAVGSHCSRAPQSWYWRWRECCSFTIPTFNSCQTWDSNPQPLDYKSDSLTIRPRLPLMIW